MAYGVTPEGFVRPRLPELRQEVVQELNDRLRNAGYAGEVETRPNSITGLLIDTFAEREAALWELAEAVYLAMYPGSASGTSLDNAVSFTGVTRLAAEPSRCYVVCYGTASTMVPAGSQIRHRTTQSNWITTADVTISPAAAADVVIVPEVIANQTYRVAIDGADYTFASDAAPTIAEVLSGLVGAVSQSGLKVASDGASLRVTSDGRVAFAVGLGGPLSLSRVGSPVLAQTANPMAEAAAVGDLDGIVSTVTGWESVTNLQAASLGRLTENDAALRARYPTGLFRLGAATKPGIGPNVRDRVAGISAIKDFQNDTDTTDAMGRPPHSIHVVVDGGLDDEIGDAIYRVKAAGIDTHGAIAVQVLSDDGDRHIVRFDRPIPVYVSVRARLTLLPASEQPFPPDGFRQVSEGIAAAGTALGIGQDVVQQRFYSAIYSTPGIAHVDLTFAHSADPAFEPQPADFSAANIPIQDFEVAKFDLSRIEVS
ncbi:baseplate J/gp47 family protein [Cupriavidus respiraculi]|uniref:baseplate J/gp47 family protein n=1 Tax=Cupriavidus respiraculi TaxID=195930 RepID=UPI001C944B31|nr:baseplate J/gp47 family protein [Cupriavidus respiraculi]MBY4945405.1 baseplate J/gp47 family protein [Cupriavidus respiraculi]